MDNERLLEIKYRVAALPTLEKRLEEIGRRIYDAEAEVRSLLRKYEAESMDVEELKKKSLSATLMKLIGIYEGRLNKETQEVLKAKVEYDKACQRVSELKNERDDLARRISELRREKRSYEDEIRKREEAIKNNVNAEIYAEYQQLETEREALMKQMVETEEALKAAARVKSTINSAMKHLDSAEGWATYDVWFKGGIISHMAKYGHIDDAEADFHRLHSQMKDLQKELSDVSLYIDPEIGKIDSATRAVDFWFDNIFTDLNVRNRIRDDMEQLRSLSGKIQSIISRLEKNKTDIKNRLTVVEQRKNELIISS
ncbi:hypothetical protein V6C42_14065 [Pseudoclostridium thermosuccinogenes]|uniref:hypothetical protein n=1 Tax=Clostridium thermosuccinogenes TaxID=84032 RepID=UPI002FDA142C